MTILIQNYKYIPISLYIHIPWCIKKCPYCDFNSYEARSGFSEENYITRLLENLQQQHHLAQNRKLQSIFIGGGTPSLFSASNFAHFFKQLTQYIELEENAEITIEANPGSSDRSNFEGYYQAGINRISLGIQSLNNVFLKKLGRVHDANQAQLAFASARAAGFNNINTDLMFGLPGQNLEDALLDLTTVISWKPDHISWYQLTIEPNTFFYRYPPQLPDDDLTMEIYSEGKKLLAQAGFHHYEVSAYAQAEKCSKHNLNYWLFGDYLGIGAGAHSKITNLKNKEIYRSWCWRQPKAYLEHKTFVAEEKKIAAHEITFEFMLNALRLFQKIPVALFEERTGLNLSEIEQPLKQAKKLELLHVKNGFLETTQKGQLFLNDLVELFL